MTSKDKYEQLKTILRTMDSVLVAFSGGVDSSLLAYAAYHVLGDKAIAVTAVSPTMPHSEIVDAERIAQHIGISHLVMPSDEFNDEHFVANLKERCYFCKKIRFTALIELARQRGFQWVADGSNVDDLGDFRPGMAALKELSGQVRSPMVEAELSKSDIRSLSKAAGLATWDKQSAACLASRIPYGTPLSADILKQVEQAEAYITPFIHGSLRVRYHGSVARIEVRETDMPVIMAHRMDISKALRQYGFQHIALDLNGYEMGSLNQDILPEKSE